MFGAEVNRCDSPFGADGCFAHDSTRSHPLGGIRYFTGRVQILDNIVMFQQISRFLSGHYHFPRSSVVSHYIYRAIHHGSQRILFHCRSLIFGKAPIVRIGIQQCGPQAAGQFQRQGTFYGTLQLIDIQIFKKSLRPLFRPCFRTGRQGIFRQVTHYFVKCSTGMFGKEITEGNPFVISAHFYIKTIQRTVFLGEMECRRVIMVAHFATFTVKRFPDIIRCRCISYRVYFKVVHPTGGLYKLALSQCHFPDAVIQFQPGTRFFYNGLSLERNLIKQTVDGGSSLLLIETYFLYAARRGQSQFPGITRKHKSGIYECT